MRQIELNAELIALPLEVYSYFNKMDINESILNVSALKLWSMGEEGIIDYNESIEVAKSINGNNIMEIIEKYDLWNVNDTNTYYAPVEFYKKGCIDEYSISDFIIFYLRNVTPVANNLEEAKKKLIKCLKYIPELEFLFDYFEECENLEQLYNIIVKELENTKIIL